MLALRFSVIFNIFITFRVRILACPRVEGFFHFIHFSAFILFNLPSLNPSLIYYRILCDLIKKTIRVSIQACPVVRVAVFVSVIFYIFITSFFFILFSAFISFNLQSTITSIEYYKILCDIIKKNVVFTCPDFIVAVRDSVVF